MKSSIEYLNEALGIIGEDSVRKASVELRIAHNSISNYASGERTMDNYACFMVARVLGIDPLLCLCSATYEREKAEDKKQFWLDLWNEINTRSSKNR